MKAMFGVLGLVLVLGIVGLLARKQLTAVSAPLPALQDTAGAQAGASSAAQGATPRQQVQQVQQAVQGIMQQARPAAEDQAPSK